MISNHAKILVSSWPARLKSLLWRKVGEGCLSQHLAEGLERRVDHAAAQATLRPFEEVSAETTGNSI